MATRHQVRQSVISMLYANEMKGASEEFINEFLEDRKIRNKMREYALSLYNGVNSNLDRIDESLNAILTERDLSHLGVVERSILRLGAWEILNEEIDKAVIINEAIELAKELGSDSAPKFINGVLDALKNGGAK